MKVLALILMLAANTSSPLRGTETNTVRAIRPVLPAAANATYWVTLEGCYAIEWAPTPAGPWQYCTNVVFPPATFTAANCGSNRFFRGTWREIPVAGVTTNKP